MRSRGRVLALALSEATANARVWAILTVPLGALSLMLGAGLTWSTAEAANDSLTEIEMLRSTGRHVLRVIPVGEKMLPAAFCEQLRSVRSIHASYGVGPVGQTLLSTGVSVTTQQATAGIWDFLDVLPIDNGARGALTGATVSDRNGLVDGGWLEFADLRGDGVAEVAQTRVLELSPRTTSFDDSVILDLPLSAEVSECRVEPVAGTRIDVATALAALTPAEAVAVVSLRPDIEDVDEPDRRLMALPGSLATGGAGVVGGLGILGWWFIRRAEWALYRTFGLSLTAIWLLASLEWFIVCCAPMVIGGLWGIAATTTGTADLAYRLAAFNLIAALLIALATTALWGGYIQAFSTNLALRGL